MPTLGSPNLHSLVRSAATPNPRDVSDAELMRRFAADRDEAAFAAIVRRHGGMVFDVCRCVLRNDADAEDAFQATFLILVRKCGSLRKADSLAAWLHGVAVRTARKALAAVARRRKVEPLAPVRDAASPDDQSWGEVRRIVHEELHALPDRYRAPLVLCYLQGLTQEQTATALGVTAVAVKKRLERGRGKLRAALARRGFGPAAVLAVLTLPAGLSAVPPTSIASVSRLAVGFLAGTPVGGTIPAQVLDLVEGGLWPMLLIKLNASVSALAVLGLGAVLLAAGGRPVEHPGGGLVPFAAAAEVDDAADRAAEAKRFAGEWTVARIEMNGSTLPKAEVKEFRFTIKGNTATVKKDATLAAALAEFTFKVDPKRSPAAIDVTFKGGPLLKDNPVKGETVRGIYVLKDESLRICLRLEQPERGRPKGFVTSEGSGLCTIDLLPVADEVPPAKNPPKPSDMSHLDDSTFLPYTRWGTPTTAIGQQKYVARLALEDHGWAQGIHVAAAIIEVMNRGPAAQVEFDPKNLRLELSNERGEVVPQLPLSKLSSDPVPISASLVTNVYAGFTTYRGRATVPPGRALLTAGWNDWALLPGKYTLKGSATITTRTSGTIIDGGTAAVQEESVEATKPRELKVELKPVTFTIPE